MEDIFIPMYRWAKRMFDDDDFVLHTFLYNNDIPYAISYRAMSDIKGLESVSFVTSYISVKDYIKYYVNESEKILDFEDGMMFPFLSITWFYEISTCWKGDIGFVNPKNIEHSLSFFSLRREDVYNIGSMNYERLFIFHEDYLQYVYEDYDIPNIMKGMGIQANNPDCKIDNEMLKGFYEK
jgi:hypothetical protein